MGKLALYLPDGTVHEIPLDKERITIGRRADNDICLPYPAVSGEHAAVVTILADSFLEDLGSTNGTLVNGRSIVKHFLRDQDAVDIGRQRLVYLANDEDAAEPLAPDQLMRGIRELDEQVARVRASRRPAPAQAPQGGERSASPAGSASTARSPVPQRSSDPPDSFDDEVANDLGSVTSPEDQREAATSDAAHGPLAAHARAPAQPLEADVGFGERSGELGQLIEARRRWVPKSERPKDSSDAAPDVDAQSVVRRRVSTIQEFEDAPPATREGPRLRVVEGPNSGREVVLAKDVTTFGRVGLQVAQIRRARDGWEIVGVEGSDPPMVNGVTLKGKPVAVTAGDVITVAGHSLTLIGA